MTKIRYIYDSSRKLSKIFFFVYNILFNLGSKGKHTSFKCDGLLQGCRFSIKGVNNTILIGECSRLKHCKFYINGNNNKIIIGKDGYFENTEFYVEDDNGQILIGNQTAICGKTQLASIESCIISIGDDCLFSSEISVRTGDSHIILNKAGRRVNASKDVIINNHIWVGNRVSILKGVVIGENSIIGAGSVVTSGVTEEPNCIYAGNPAKMIKQEINWDSIRNNIL